MNVPAEESRGENTALPVLLADETQLLARQRLGGFMGIGVGLVFCVSMGMAMFRPIKGDVEAVYLIFLFGLAVLIGGLCAVCWRHRFYLLPDRAEIEEASGLLVASARRVHPLAQFLSVELLEERREIPSRRGALRLGEPPKESVYVVRLTVGPDANARPLVLGEFDSPTPALDLAISTAVATGLDLVDTLAPEGTRRVRAASLRRIETPADAGAVPGRRLTAIALIVANFVPMFGVLFAGWALLPVLVLFWCENVIVGVLNVLRMLFAGQGHSEKLFMIPIFIFHYGAFCLGHAAFLLILFGGQHGGRNSDLLEGADRMLAIVARDGLWVGVLALLASHGFSFIRNYLGGAEYLRLTPGDLMAAPYARVVVMHVALMLGALMVAAFETPAVPLAVLVVGKIGIDLHAHLSEHRRFSLARYEADSELGAA